jgi:hypothetical protein
MRQPHLERLLQNGLVESGLQKIVISGAHRLFPPAEDRAARP